MISSWNKFRQLLASNSLVIREVSIQDLPLKKLPESSTNLALYLNHGFGQLVAWISFLKDENGVIAVEKPEIMVDAMLFYLKKKQFPYSFPFGTLTVPERNSYLLSLECVMHYQPNLAGKGLEEPYGIFVYPSSTYTSLDNEVAFVPFRDISIPTIRTFHFRVAKDHIPAYSLLNFDSYAIFTNSEGKPCINQSGYHNYSLSDLANDLGTRHKFKLVVPNSKQHYTKGILYLTVKSVSLPTVVKTPMKLYLQEETERTGRLTQEYVKRNHSFYDSHPASSSSIQTVTVYTFQGRRKFTPGSLYDLFYIPVSHEEYYLKAMEIAAKRVHPFSSFEEAWKVKKTRTPVIMRMLCLFVNYCTYITDIVKNGTVDELIESFDMNIRIRDAADCEDFTLEILIEVMEIKYNKNDFQSSIMLKVRKILEQFIFCSTLCGVSRSSMGLSTSLEHTKLSGHEAGVAIPKFVFFEALRRSQPDHAILQVYPSEEQERGKTEKHIYVLEGTGNLIPEPCTPSSQYCQIRSFFAPFASKYDDLVCKEFFYDPNRADNFYKLMITLLTPEFFYRCGLPNFEFLVCKNGKRGVLLGELVNLESNRNIAIFSAPEMSVDLFRAATRLNADNIPPTPLYAVPSSSTQVTPMSCSAPCPKKVSLENIFQFQIKLEDINANKELVEEIQTIAEAQSLDMMCVPEFVKMNHETGQVCGGYNFLFWRK